MILFDMDMLFTPVEAGALFGTSIHSRIRKKRAASKETKYFTKYWPNATIPYSFKDNSYNRLSEEDKKQVYAAMK